MSKMSSTPFHTLVERRNDTPLTDAYDQAHGDPLTDETRYMCMVDWARSLERRLAASEAAVKRLYNESQQSKSWPSEPTPEMLRDGASAYEGFLNRRGPTADTFVEAMRAAYRAMRAALPSQPHKPGGEIAPEPPYCDCPGWCLSKDRPKPVRCLGYQLPEEPPK